MADNFEEQYIDVLQNIESSLFSIYHKYPQMTDHGALYVVEALLKVYSGELQGRTTPVPKFQTHEQEACDSVRAICEWRMGRAQLKDEKGDESSPDITPITVEETVACLKRIKKSIEFWQKRGGRRAYAEYVGQFLK